MNENIDLTKILEGCPEGTVFYSSIHDEVKFLHIDKSIKCPIVTLYDYDYYAMFGKDARLIPDRGECVLFPSKDQRDWSKFERFWDRKFDLNTLEPFDKVLVRNRKTELWLTDMFTFHIDEPVAKCITGAYMQCIPYNEDTKHLLGTTNDCPEYYKWWSE